MNASLLRATQFATVHAGNDRRKQFFCGAKCERDRAFFTILFKKFARLTQSVCWSRV
jgi:hypothetical protein